MNSALNSTLSPVVGVSLIVLVQYFFFGALVAIARVRQNVPAPAMQGPADFERLSRVQLNTHERLILLLPLLWLAALMWRPDVAAGLGIVFAVGRHLYWRGYVRDPASRGVGNIITLIAIASLMLIVIVQLVRGVALA